MELKRVEEIYSEMGAFVVELDPNPAARGPQYLQDLISKTRGYLNATMFFLQEVLQERHRKEMELESQETAFDVSSDELLAEDRRVTSLPSIDDRRAMIKVILHKERREIKQLQREILEVENRLLQLSRDWVVDPDANVDREKRIHAARKVVNWLLSDERVVETCHSRGIALAMLPGDDQPAAELGQFAADLCLGLVGQDGAVAVIDKMNLGAALGEARSATLAFAGDSIALSFDDV